MIERAQPELLSFAAAVRGEEWADELSLAMAAVATAGWDWDRQAKFACRLILTDGASPRELRDAARDPLKPGPDGTVPQSAAADLAAARARAAEAAAAYRGQTGGDAA